MPKSGFLSDIKFRTRLVLVCLLVLLPSLILIVSALIILPISESARKKESEQTIMAASEQYISTAVDNSVYIAKTAYTNRELYELINNRYKDAADYYAAYYEIKDSNPILASENNSVSGIMIYSDNPTILSGGAISRMEKVRGTEWYNTFSRLNKDMIFYCDSATGKLSLLRKMDYYTVNTGDCILKIDLNSEILQECFKNLKFSGNIYVMNGGTLLFSNTGDSDDKINITSDYSCMIKNYYTVDIEYYSRADMEIGGMGSEWIIIPVAFLLIYAVSVTLIIRLLKNVTDRMKHLNGIYDIDKGFCLKDSDLLCKDEVGELFRSCAELSEKLEQVENDDSRHVEQLNSCIYENNMLMLDALGIEAVLNSSDNARYMKFREDNIICPLDAELKKAADFAKTGVTEGKKLTVGIDADTEKLKVLSVPLLSVTMAVYDIVLCGFENNDEIALKIKAAEENGYCVISVGYDGNEISAGRLLKLRSIFEKEKSDNLWDFMPGYQYNPFIRLKKYYLESISAVFSSENGFEMRLTLPIDVMTPKNYDVKE